MKHLFVPYEMALSLKGKGFDLRCLYAYCERGGWNKYTKKHDEITFILRTDGNPFGEFYAGKNWNNVTGANKNKIQCSAPTYQQVVDWFREKHNIIIELLYQEGTSNFSIMVGKIGELAWFSKQGETYPYYEALTEAINHAITLLP